MGEVLFLVPAWSARLSKTCNLVSKSRYGAEQKQNSAFGPFMSSKDLSQTSAVLLATLFSFTEAVVPWSLVLCCMNSTDCIHRNYFYAFRMMNKKRYGNVSTFLYPSTASNWRKHARWRQVSTHEWLWSPVAIYAPVKLGGTLPLSTSSNWGFTNGMDSGSMLCSISYGGYYAFSFIFCMTPAIAKSFAALVTLHWDDRLPSDDFVKLRTWVLFFHLL